MKILHSLILKHCFLNTKLIKCSFFKKRVDYETELKTEMNKIIEQLNGDKAKLATLSNILSIKKIKKTIKMLEKEKESLSSKQSYNFEIVLEQ